jgi:hypothetical protein
MSRIQIDRKEYHLMLNGPLGDVFHRHSSELSNVT